MAQKPDLVIEFSMNNSRKVIRFALVTVFLGVQMTEESACANYNGTWLFNCNRGNMWWPLRRLINTTTVSIAKVNCFLVIAIIS